MSPVLTPAYGRDYKSKAEVIAALERGDAFLFYDPYRTAYGSIRDLAVGQTVTVRYGKLLKVMTYTKRGDK